MATTLSFLNIILFLFNTLALNIYRTGWIQSFKEYQAILSLFLQANNTWTFFNARNLIEMSGGAAWRLWSVLYSWRKV